MLASFWAAALVRNLCFDLPGLSVSEQSVLVAICRYADNATYDCYPSRSLIATVSRLQERQVQRIIPTLIERGYISREVGKGRSSSRYTVQVASIKELISRGDTETPLSAGQEGDEGLDRGDIQTPLPETVDVTSGLLRGDIDAIDGETQGLLRGDIHASLYKEESVIESVSKESVSAIGYTTSAHKQAKEHAHNLMEELKTLTPEALGDLAYDIACRHPRSRLRMWTRRNVGQADTVAILDAMADEAQPTE
ncbi:helix-turn-helix domain-containing protein [Edaphobacter aggregans]|uniref:helix-turn-helix domain-containing protein n=1 Tax=Edaphobacter aggregans TaxID=570835 RepID=UPI001B80CF54|nr:helix-turn-helix domain-containing protein [Edaphobacter aggregans]